MDQFEYLKVSPHIKDGEFVEGYIEAKTKGLFGKEIIAYKDKTISEDDWLRRKGEDGWELVCVLRNSMSYDLRDYYFKRKKQ